MARLSAEQINMPPRPLKPHGIGINFVNQQPVWLKMQIAPAFPIAF